MRWEGGGAKMDKMSMRAGSPMRLCSGGTTQARIPPLTKVAGLRITPSRLYASPVALSRQSFNESVTPWMNQWSNSPCLSIVVACFSTASVIWLPESMRANSRARSFSLAKWLTAVRVRPARSNFST